MTDKKTIIEYITKFVPLTDEEAEIFGSSFKEVKIKKKVVVVESESSSEEENTPKKAQKKKEIPTLQKPAFNFTWC